MKQCMILLIAVLFCTMLFGAKLENSSGLLYFPTAGVVNRSQGTIEITVTPVADVKDIRNDWVFAFQVPGKNNALVTRTALGIYCPSGNPENDLGLRGILRGTNNELRYLEDRESPIKAGETVNMALSWGPEGFLFYVNGKVLRKTVFRNELIEIAPYFKIGNDSPFYASRVKVSAVQLKAAEIAADPGKPFQAGSECTLLANDFTKPEFFAAPEFKKRGFVSLLPFAFTDAKLLREDEKTAIQLIGNNFTAQNVELPIEITITPFNSEKSQKVLRKVTLGANTLQKLFSIDAGELPAGFYRVEIKAGEQEMRFINLSILPKADIKPGKLAEYLGLPSNREPEMLKKMEIKWARSWGKTEFNWFQLEPVKGKFDFRTVDKVTDALTANGVNTLAVLGYPPLWAAEPPPTEGPLAKYRYRRTEPGRWKPRDIADWNRYVEATARHFKGRVNHYEIYNEVDFHPPALAESFSGSTEEYFELLKGASNAIRKADSAGKVLISGFSHTPGATDMAMPEQLLKLGAANYVDIWNVHSYRAKVGMAEMKKMVQAVKPGMPIWQTEQMWHVISDPVRRAYLTGAINIWFLELAYDKYFGFGWGGDVLSDLHTLSPDSTLHAFALSNYYLARCDKYEGTIPGIPPGEFDVNASLRRSDGTYLAVFGSSAGNYQMELAGKILDARDGMGNKVTCSGNRLKTNGELFYVVTPTPLKVLSAKLESTGELLTNTGFEDLVGDTMGGLDKTRFTNWIIRTNYDPAAKVSISDKDGNGRYAAQIHTSGKGRVYLFEYLKMAATGTYQVTAHFKNVSGNAKPYISVFDTSPGAKLLLSEYFVTPSKEHFTRYTFTFQLDKVPEDNLAVIFGIDKEEGTMLLDDVSMIRVIPQKVADKDAVFIELPAVKEAPALTRNRETIDLAESSKLGTGKRVFGGYPFQLNDGYLACADNSWQNPLPSQVKVKARCKSVLLLASAMYNDPKQGSHLADLLFTYADGSTAAVPIQSNVHVRDWYLLNEPPNPIPSTAPYRSSDLKEFGFFTSELKNPNPTKEITSISLRSRAKGIIVVKSITLVK